MPELVWVLLVLGLLLLLPWRRVRAVRWGSAEVKFDPEPGWTSRRSAQTVSSAGTAPLELSETKSGASSDAQARRGATASQTGRRSIS